MTKIGPYNLYSIETGRFALDGGAMFGVIPKPLWEKRTLPDNRNRIPLNMRCLLLEGNGKVILIDNGLGDKYDAKFKSIYAVDHEKYELHRSLNAIGFQASDITDVVLTHLHFDHCGGSTSRNGDRLEVAFPNAEFHIQKQHWKWAGAPNAREKASFLKDNLEPLAASGQLRLLEGNGHLFDGVEVITVNGHTEAQQMVKIQGAEGTLVFVADLIPTAAHLRGPWIMGYDIRPLVSLQEKTDFLERAVQEGWHLFFEHDSKVIISSLLRTERGIESIEPRPLQELF